MGTVAEKLAKVLETKAALRAAIREKGVEVTGDDPFSTYPDKVRAIAGGGGIDIDAYRDGACIDFAATAGENTLHLKTQENGFDCTIHWGDGTSTEVPASGGNVLHTYAEAGTYRIYITGRSFAGFYVNRQEGAEKYVALYSMGKWEEDTMVDVNHAFDGCVSLTSLPGDLFRNNPNILQFGYTFLNCTGLLELPGDLFRYNTKAEIFTAAFRGCVGLKSLPGDLFRYNVLATNFNLCFRGCTNLEEVPEKLFNNNLNATFFEFTFQDCDSLRLNPDIFGDDLLGKLAQASLIRMDRCFYRKAFTGERGTAPALWEVITPASSIVVTDCFSGAGNSETSLSNYEAIPDMWK